MGAAETPLAPQPLLARDEAARVRLAANPDTAPGVLQHLAADPLVTVRAAVALNPAAPPKLNLHLAADGDARVRTLLAHKLATLLPQTSSRERAGLREQVLATLSTLVGDEVVRVRAAIADVLKEMPQAPRELILRLAEDAEVSVSAPVIRLSPLLTTQDLLSLLARPPSAGTALAIAGRSGLDEAVADAIAATANTAAVATLLRNPSAAIRESTLDALAARAVAHEEWHDPLVRHPRLSSRAARVLSDFVATHLLEALAARADLDGGVVAELQERLTARLQAPPPAPDHCGTMDAAITAAQRAVCEGKIDEAVLLGAAQRGDTRLCVALLAVAAGTPVAVVERAATLRSAKGLISLVWAAGFTMRAAAVVQELLGGLPPHALLHATPSGDFPLAAEEMRWQLDLLKRLDRHDY